jgi:hypothetical protein
MFKITFLKIVRSQKKLFYWPPTEQLYGPPYICNTYMEVVSLAFELSRGVDLISHDPGDGLLHILHPLCHLGMAHFIHLLDELVIFLPKRHLGSVKIWLFKLALQK